MWKAARMANDRTSTTPALNATRQGNRIDLVAEGSWTISYAEAIENLVSKTTSKLAGTGGVAIDLHGVNELDTLGAWLLERLTRSAQAQGGDARLVAVPERFQGLFGEIEQVNRKKRTPVPTHNALIGWLEAIGRGTAGTQEAVTDFFAMFGVIGVAAARVVTRPWTFRLTSSVHHLYRVGWQAIPIILLITFLIGGIIAQQGFFHFRKFGAEPYVVDMVGILVLRELGVLIVSIMVAGRSGSAYTAELGSMKMREEIDALRTMGHDPVEVLMLPRIIALVVAVPILTFFGSMSALYGGGLIAWLYGDMSPAIFIERLKEAISVTHFQVGMIKAPFMALVIGIVACSEGLKVKGSAASLGERTTTSVVKAIFLVIVLDGLFAIFFASIGM
jgi:phospholipid/cholesterol/gamma-HCH transport system permease protein